MARTMSPLLRTRGVQKARPGPSALRPNSVRYRALTRVRADSEDW
ncbi:hypothetical protein BH24ACT4_BH24ACT4_04500 [soil metagenome]